MPRDVFVEKRVEVPYDVVIEIPEIKKIKRSVKVPRYVERPYEVIKEVDIPIKRS